MSPERKRLTGMDPGEGDHYRYGGFLKDIERFDAGLFGISGIQLSDETAVGSVLMSLI